MGQFLEANIDVVCYAGHRADVSPRYFFLGERKVKVELVLDQWIGPDHRYFKIKGNDRAVYIIRHDLLDDTWELRMFDGRAA